MFTVMMPAVITTDCYLFRNKNDFNDSDSR